MKQANNNQAPSTAATTGADSLGKVLRRNASAQRLALLFSRGVATVRTRGWQALGREVGFRLRLATKGQIWRYRADIPLRRQLRAQRQHPPVPAPLISVVVPLYNTPPRFLAQLLNSVRAQSYANWELVLADGSENDTAATVVRRHARQDGRVRLLPLDKNRGIAENTNAGLNAARGEWICLVDHDDVLQPHALYEVAAAAAATGAEFIYSDEVVLSEDLKRLHEFHFKGDFGPDTLRGCNVITHLVAFTRPLLQRAGGGERAEYDGAQDYDLILRLTEAARGIHHIPQVLYFWRRHGGSTAQSMAQKPQAAAAGAAAVRAQLQRGGLNATVESQAAHPGAYRLRYAVTGTPRVSVLIPSCDHTDDLHRCLESLYEKAGWPALEVLVLDNNSQQADTAAYYAQAKARWPGLRVLHYPGAFNYAAINNWGAAQAGGQHLLLLNNDVEVIDDGFVAELLGYSQRADVGAVGAMLYYPDDTVQHAGLIVGLGGTAGVSHKGHPRGNGGDMYRLCTTQNVTAVTGAALMVKTALYRQLNGLDEERFAVAFNDVDFCLRLHKAGYWNVFTPFATAYHFESKSRGYDTEGPRRARFEAEAAAFRAQHADILRVGDPFYNPHFTLEHENFGYR